MERGEWDEEPEYPRAPLPAHERQWRHPSEQGATEWNRSEPPLVVGRGLSVATGTVGAVLAIGLLWLMVPHSNRSGGGVAEVSSTVHAVGGGDGSVPRQTNLPLSIVSSSSVPGSSSQGNSTIGSGTTGRTFAPSTAGPVGGVATSPIDETTSSSDPDDSTDASVTSASPPPSAGTNTTPTTTQGTGSGVTSSTGAGGSTPTSTATPPSGPTINGPTTPTVPPTATTSSASTTTVSGGGSGGVALAVTLTDEHFVATTAAAVGGQSSLNVQLPSGNTVVGNVVSVGSGIAVLSIPSNTETTPMATSTASTTDSGAMVMSPEPTPATVWHDDSGTQITYDPAAHVSEGALVLDSAKHLVGMCTLTDSGVHVVDAQALLEAINGAIASEPTAWLGANVDPDTLAVSFVTPGGPSEAAGIQVGDVIRAVDGVPVASLDEIKAAIQSHHPGETATLSAVKTGATDPVDVPVVLGANQGAL